MSELTDDQLDGLFRKSAEEFDPPFDPVAWRDMKTRLDANDRTVTGSALIWKSLLRWGLPILLLVLLTGGVWYAYRRTNAVASKANPQLVAKATPTLNRTVKPYHTTERPTSDKEPVRTTTVDKKESDAKAGKQPTDLMASVAEPARSENSPGKLVARSGTKPATKVISGLEAATKRSVSAYDVKTARGRSRLSTHSRLAEPTAIGSKGVVAGTTPYRRGKTYVRSTGETLSRKQRSGSGRRNSAAFVATNGNGMANPKRFFAGKRAPASQESLPIHSVNMANNALPSITGETQPVAFPTLSELMIRPAKWPALTFSGRAVVAQPDTVARRAASQPALPTERGLSIRLIVAPDLSVVGLHNFSRPGTNFGALLEYRLASRWSVQAGVIQSTKVYRASASEYGSSPNKWMVPPESVDGRCNMIDIPINMRYDVAVRPRTDGQLPSRWFVSGGVTSYIVYKEDYKFNYADPSNPHIYPSMREWSGSSGNFGFSQLNLSIGYERAFSRRLLWQVEPFLKAPLRGVGNYGINLLSTGAFFSIKYKLK